MSRTITKHSPQINLAAIRLELSAAQEACPHWDWESDGDGYDCCYRLRAAGNAVRNAELRWLREGKGRSW